MLANAGVVFELDPASVDEVAVKSAMKNSGASCDETVEALAVTKAQQVSPRHPGSLVVGADQMLLFNEEWLDKPTNIADARLQLKKLRGNEHELVSAVCVVNDGIVIWHHIDRASMTMRPFSEAFLEQYVEKMGEGIFATVGGYAVEGIGAQLFSGIEGDYFTILGMPLLPLLDFLRGHGVLLE